MGCGTARAPIEESRQLGELGFLAGGQASRGSIEARLGPPRYQYEGGRVVGYSVYEQQGKLTTIRVQYAACYALMIEYTQGGDVLRQALIPASCLQIQSQ